MALGRKYFANPKSYNGWDFHIEIFVEGFSGTATKIKVGGAGPTIHYETDDETRFNPIITSQLKLPIVVDSADIQSFVEDLRDSLVEQDVYVYLYADTTSASGAPLWAGFLLMDLGKQEDLDQPYEVILTATDGIALLKDVDWVVDGATKPYDADDMYYGPTRFSQMIAEALQKSGYATIAKGNVLNPQIATAVNWYNADISGVAQAVDPLYYTKGKQSWSFTKNAANLYTPMSTYDFLKEIMKVWGCRLIYWRNIYYVIQISQYNTADGGTYDAPVNINRRVYSMSGSPAATPSYAYLGANKKWVRYQVGVGESTTGGCRKLAGTQFNYYPRIKKATANFINGGTTNYYGGFPKYVGSTLTSPFYSNYLINIDKASSIWLHIPLALSTDYVGTNSVRIYFQVRMYDVDNPTTEKFLKKSSGNVFSWEATLPSQVNQPRWIGTFDGTQGGEVVGFSEQLPTDAAFAGTWAMEIKVDDTNWGTGPGSVSSFEWVDPDIGTGFQYDPATIGYNGDKTMNWDNVSSQNGVLIKNISPSGNIFWTSNIGNPFTGYLMGLNANNGVNQYATEFTNEVSVTNSDIYEFGELKWGDTLSSTDSGALQVYNGVNWNHPTASGTWGDGTTSGNQTLTDLLITEFMKGQKNNTQIINTRLVTSVVNKEVTDGTLTVPNFPNPIGKIREHRDGTDNIYVFKRGTWHLKSDEVDYEGFVIKSESITTTNLTSTLYGEFGIGAIDGSGNTPAKLVYYPPVGGKASVEANTFITVLRTATSGTQTAIDIVALGTDITLAKGNRLSLIDQATNVHNLELSATPSATDTRLSIVSYDFGTDLIDAGARITYDVRDLIQKYQNPSLPSCSYSPDATTTITTVGSVSNFSQVPMVTANITAGSMFSVSSGDIKIDAIGTYKIDFSLTTQVTGTANRMLVGGHLYKKLSTDGDFTAIPATQVYNYDRGIGASDAEKQYIYEDSGSGSCIINIAALEEETYYLIRLGFWIDGRTNTATDAVTIIDGCVIDIVKIG
tara:strand:+ start:2186 stop:5230 length:3045 start_codon:yes stop_codon:yes gene_type:complete